MANETGYQYGAAPTANPFRWLLACWRVSRDLTNTNEAAIVEIGFSRSWFGRRISGWEAVAEWLSQDPELRKRIEHRQRLGFVDLEELSNMPVDSLGWTLAQQCSSKNIDPNLVHLPAGTNQEFVMAHVFECHDIWHVVTGWGNDELGEVGLGGFYIAQLKLPLIALMLALILFNTVFRNPASLAPRIEALTRGYEMGKAARPLFGMDWRSEMRKPLAVLREQLQIETAHVGEGILSEAA